MESDDDNMIVARPKSKTIQGSYKNTDIDNVSTASGTRIPETPVKTPTNRTPELNRGRKRPDRVATATPAFSPIDRLRLRNAIQREEIRSKERELRRTREERDNFGTEARIYRGEIEACRLDASASRQWMKASWFAAFLMSMCNFLYVFWCRVNSAEFEFQNKIVRRNFGLE